MLVPVGYEKRGLEEFVGLLEQSRVEVLIDVRGTPRSRKPGFSKTRLADALAAVGIDYRHEGGLGVPAEHRPAFRAGDAAVIDDYRRRLTTEAADAVGRIAELARERRVALLCFERSELDCHRRLVAEAVRQRDPTARSEPLE